MASKVVTEKFFEKNPLLVAREILGMYLVRSLNGKKEKYRIVETESYGGIEDKASHVHRGQTSRNTPMFGKPGTIYVYFTYGMHWMLNIVCKKEGEPSAVLIRGIDGCIGPARLTKKLGVDKNLDGKILGKKSGLWIESITGLSGQKNKIIKTPRIGVDRSGPVWSQKPHRFVLESVNNKKAKYVKKAKRKKYQKIRR